MNHDEDRYAYAVMQMIGAALRSTSVDDALAEMEILSILETQAALCADPVLARNQMVLGLTYVTTGVLLAAHGNDLQQARETVAELGHLILRGPQQ